MLKRICLTLMGLALLLVFILYMISFEVSFDRSALVLTFGRAEKDGVINLDGKQAGLYFKWPWPIQKAVLFDRRLMTFEDRLEQQETRDKQVVIAKAFAVWRISNPLDFYRSLKDSANAEKFLIERLRSARSELGNFAFEELTNADPGKLKIAKAENAILKHIRNDLSKQKLGVEICSIGISRIILPEQITSSVFARMRQTRQRLAQSARSEGDAIARTIRSKADSDRQRILAFADREAQTIRAEGDAAAAKYYEVFARNQDFAVLLRKLETLERTLSNNTTFLLDTGTVPFDLLKNLNPDKLPTPAIPADKNKGPKK